MTTSKFITFVKSFHKSFRWIDLWGNKTVLHMANIYIYIIKLGLNATIMAKLRTILKATLHAAAAGIMGFGFHSIQKLPVDRWIRNQYGGHLQFLTIQG